MPDASGRIPPVSYGGRAGATLERIFGGDGGAETDSPKETAHPGDWTELHEAPDDSRDRVAVDR